MPEGRWRPTPIELAVEALSYRRPGMEPVSVPAFSQRWGGLDYDALTRALHEASGDERLFALVALSHFPPSKARALLVPFLESEVPLERWASAIGLGRMRDKRALPTLCAMLTDFMPSRLEDYLAEVMFSPYEVWRASAPDLLQALGDPAAVPALRQALPHLVRLLGQESLSDGDAALLDRAQHRHDALTMDEFQRVDRIMEWIGPRTTYTWARDPNATTDLPHGAESVTAPGTSATLYRIDLDEYEGELRNVIDYQDEVIFTLGRLGALGALIGLQAAEPFLHVWVTHLLMGYLYDRYARMDVSPRLSSALEADLKQGLFGCFGLTPVEQERALALYTQTKLWKAERAYEFDGEDLEWEDHGDAGG